MTTPLNIDEAHTNYTSICNLRHSINNGFWVLVEQLKNCREQKYWETLGYDSFASYLAQPEIDFNLHTVDNWITTYNRIKEHNLLPPEGVIDIGISKLSMIAPYLTTENASDLLYKAKTLSRNDLRSEMTGIEPIVKQKCTCPLCGNTHIVGGKG